MSDNDQASFDFPTLEQVRRWRAQLDLLRAEEAEMKARHTAEESALKKRRMGLDKLIAAASAFMEVEEKVRSEPDSGSPVAEPKATPLETATPRKRSPYRGRNKTWTATMLKIIRPAGRGMTYPELKEEVAKTHLGNTLKRTDKAFYGAIGKLAESGDIVKYHGRVFSPASYHQFKEDLAAGRVADIPDRVLAGKESPNEIAVTRFLSNCPNGATAREIVGSLLNDPPPDLAVTTNATSIYNLLARQRKSEKLIRRGDRYYLPTPNDEAPGSSEPGAANHHGNGGGTLFSSGSGRAALRDAFPAHPGE